MNYLIIAPGKLKYTPYLSVYIERLCVTDNTVDIVYWNRDGQAENTEMFNSANLYEFKCNQDDRTFWMKKSSTFFQYRKYIKSLIKSKNYDTLIVLTTPIALALVDVLTCKYTGKYVFDYRDYSHENIGIYKRLVALLVNRSKCTFVSSDGFRQFLPKTDKIYTVHNCKTETLKYKENIISARKKCDVIRIGFWGYIRDVDVNIALVDRLSNDKRFELHYYGREGENGETIKKYSIEKGSTNVFFHGEYEPNEVYKFAEETEIIDSIYWDTGMITAMPNKYYDGVMLHIPQLGMPGTFIEKNINEHSVGFSYDPHNDDFADKVFEYYNSIDFNDFDMACEKECKRVMEENDNSYSHIFD